MLQLHRPLFGNFVGTMGQSDSLVRTSMAYAFWLPTAAPMGRTQGLPVLAHGAYTHARGLSVRPRQVPLRLAILGAVSMAFGSGNSLGTWELNSISRLNTRPTCAPVNASGTSLQACPHDSGSSWVASPSKCEFLLRYTMPVYPGASPGTSRHTYVRLLTLRRDHLGPARRRPPPCVPAARVKAKRISPANRECVQRYSQLSQGT
jgi:hypothetical protein